MDSSPEGQTTDVAEAEPPAAARIGRSRRPARPWPPPQGQWTFADYAGLPDNGFRYEVIHGGLYMSPASRPRHHSHPPRRTSASRSSNVPAGQALQPSTLPGSTAAAGR